MIRVAVICMMHSLYFADLVPHAAIAAIPAAPGTANRIAP
jgi:hypothetical protein